MGSLTTSLYICGTGIGPTIYYSYISTTFITNKALIYFITFSSLPISLSLFLFKAGSYSINAA